LPFVSFCIYKYELNEVQNTNKNKMSEQDFLHKLKSKLQIQNMIMINIGNNTNSFYKNVGNCL
jgi:hypothetical protein